MDVTGLGGDPQHDIPPPPDTASAAAFGRSTTDATVVGNPFAYDDPPLVAGQLAPRWKTMFVGGWVGVLVGFGCIWQAGRVAGIAPWWLGPQTDPRSFVVIASPFVAPLIAIGSAVARLRVAAYVGLVAGLISMAVALGDLGDHPGLAAAEALIGLAGLLISVACLGGRMRRPI